MITLEIYKQKHSEKFIIDLLGNSNADGVYNFLINWDGDMESAYRFCYYSELRIQYFDLLDDKVFLQDEIYCKELHEEFDEALELSYKLERLCDKLLKYRTELLKYWDKMMLVY